MIVCSVIMFVWAKDEKACFFKLTCVSLEQAVGAPEVLRVFYHRDLRHANDDSVRAHF